MDKELNKRVISIIEDLIQETEYALECSLQADGDGDGDACSADSIRATLQESEEILSILKDQLAEGRD